MSGSEFRRGEACPLTNPTRPVGRLLRRGGQRHDAYGAARVFILNFEPPSDTHGVFLPL